MLELPWPSGYELRLSLDEVAGSNPGKSHWWTAGRASSPKMLTAPAKSQLTIGHRPSPVKTGSACRKTTSGCLNAVKFASTFAFT